MKQSETDPKVSCPIVCSEYMRASGFFFATATQTYLVTARHNLLPTDSSTLAIGQAALEYETEDFLPRIDIYLQDGGSCARYHVDIRNITGVRFHAAVDVIGIPIDFNPQDYGYTVWTSTDITSIESTDNTVDSIGFPGYSIPPEDCEFDTEQYRNDISKPYVVTLSNELPGLLQHRTDTGLIKLGFNTDSGTKSSEYNGFSGSPVLGDGLAGIHLANNKFVPEDPEAFGFDDIISILYTRADILPKLLSD